MEDVTENTSASSERLQEVLSNKSEQQLPLRENDVIIIDDSLAVCMFITNFLKKLGFQKITSRQTGESGIYAVNQINESGGNPFVFLDYVLPDRDARSIIEEIHKIKLDTKVILETASDSRDDGVKDVVALGAYGYLKKPIKFDDIKKLIEHIEYEESI